MADVETRLAALEARIDELEDLNAIRRLQNAYGYYIDYNRPEEVAGLFSEDGAVVFLSGEYRGHAGIMRLYGADSDDRAHVFRSDAAQRSDLIARR